MLLEEKDIGTLASAGSGTLEDPWLITSIPEEYSHLTLDHVSQGIYFKNFSLGKLTLKNCENISIGNCTIGKLQLLHCNYLNLARNKISKVKVRNTTNSRLEDNQIRAIYKGAFLRNLKTYKRMSDRSNFIFGIIIISFFTLILFWRFLWSAYIIFIILSVLIIVVYRAGKYIKRKIDKSSKEIALNNIVSGTRILERYKRQETTLKVIFCIFLIGFVVVVWYLFSLI